MSNTDLKCPQDKIDLQTTDVLVEYDAENYSEIQNNGVIQFSQHNVYYIPGFFRIKVKNFTEMDLDNLDAQMNATLIFTIFYGNLDKKIVELLKKRFVLNFERDNALLLTEYDGHQTKIKQDQEKHEIQFTIRKIFRLRAEGNVFWTPFQIINLILTITVQPVKTQYGTIKVNLMDLENREIDEQIRNYIKISYTEEGTFGYYDLAEKLMEAKYSNDRVCTIKKRKFFCKDNPETIYQDKVDNQNQKGKKNQEEPVVKCFQYAHFIVPLYKFPTVALATIFLPLWLLAIINLGIFYQGSKLADRIASIASLMIAFVALIPTIRNQIPPNPKIVFIEILVYSQILTSLFAFIHSMTIRGQQLYNLNWRENGLFLISVSMTFANFVIVVSMLTLHHFRWQPSYNRTLQNQIESPFDRTLWSSKACDNYFNNVNNLKKTKIMKFVIQKKNKNKNSK